eukprot:2618309-Rhodomonas_salina.3
MSRREPRANGATPGLELMDAKSTAHTGLVADCACHRAIQLIHHASSSRTVLVTCSHPTHVTAMPCQLVTDSACSHTQLASRIALVIRSHTTHVTKKSSLIVRAITRRSHYGMCLWYVRFTRHI